MNSDVETIQRERGWHRDFCCSEPDCDWKDMWRNGDSIGLLPDPLADTPEGWWEFGQILKWADGEGYYFTVHTQHEQMIAACFRSGYSSLKFHQHETERGARIAALAAAVRHESEATG